mmetsp:Transcript_12178/g.17862  ORF Transcript_12178/g.17862 Transcript_12178/m.17862 type:complete len:119 (-) Transcript_12178:280-636(-)
MKRVSLRGGSEVALGADSLRPSSFTHFYQGPDPANQRTPRVGTKRVMLGIMSVVDGRNSKGPKFVNKGSNLGVKRSIPNILLLHVACTPQQLTYNLFQEWETLQTLLTRASTSPMPDE